MVQIIKDRHIKLFKQILEKIEFNIVRDYRELTLLQQGKFTNNNFAERTINRAIDKVVEALEDYFPAYGLVVSGNIIKDAEKDFFIVIELISPKELFFRALPFFSLSLTLCKKNEDNKEALVTLVNFPILEEEFWSYGDQVFSKNGLIQCSQNDKLDNHIIIAIDPEFRTEELSQYIQLNFAALNYELILLSQGKIDMVYRKFNYLEEIISSLLILEKAGFLLKIDKENKIIKATNLKLKGLL